MIKLNPKLARISVGAIIALGFGFVGYNPNTGQARAGLFDVSASDELSYGKKSDEQIVQQSKTSSDPAKNELVRSVGQGLAPYTDRPDIHYTFRVVIDPSINAFSVPGHVYVNTGLLEFIKGDRNMREELSGVIAHELGHTGGRHIAKQLAEQQRASVGASILSIFTKSRYDQVLNVGANMFLLGHSRSDEYDADRRGVNTLMRAGVDPNGMVTFFTKLEAKYKDNGKLQEYFQTHPMTSDRISRVKQTIKDNDDHGVPLAKSG